MCAKKKKANPLEVAFPGQKTFKVKPPRRTGNKPKATAAKSEDPRKDPEQEKFNEFLVRALENPDCVRAIRSAMWEDRAGPSPFNRHLIT